MILFVCTGNAVRSVMAEAFSSELARRQDGVAPLVFASAGTHALEGRPLSMRTREALEAVTPRAALGVAGHRSTQLDEQLVAEAELLVVMEADHLTYVRRNHSEAAARTGMLRHLARSLEHGVQPLGARVGSLGLDAVAPDGALDVPDPAGGETDDYRGCALEVLELCRGFVPRLATVEPG